MARSATRATAADALPEWVALQLTWLVDVAQEGDAWLHEIKATACLEAIDRGSVKLLPRTDHHRSAARLSRLPSWCDRTI